jgi:hypothetical protein
VTVPDSGPWRSSAVPAVWGNVPQRNKNFTGREDILADLRRQVTTDATVLLPHALQGIGGVGKTSVAVEYSYRYRADYDVVWWIPADQLALARASLAALASRLGIESAAATGIDSAAAATLDALRRGEPYNRWLLIFDNADEPEDLNSFIPRGPGHVLVTSRNHRWQAVVETLPLDVFTREESVEFLGKRIPKAISVTEANQLAEELGGLPLALEQAGALLAETGMSAQEYLGLLHEHVAEIMAEGRSPEYPHSMTAAWKLSTSSVARQLPEALNLLRCLSFFGPQPIPRDILRRSSRLAETEVGDLVTDPILLARAIRQLGRYALLTIDGRMIQVHRLIQALIRDELTSSEQGKYQHDVHLLAVAGAPADPGDRMLWPRFAELVPHVLAPAADFTGCQHLEVRGFVLNVIRYLYDSGDRSSCLLMCERFIERWQLDSGPDDLYVLAARGYLGNALRELGQIPESYTVVEAAARRAQTGLGDHHPITLTLSSTLGASLRAQGDFRAALALDRELLGSYQTVLGEDDPQTLRALSYLALDCVLTSEYRQAREHYERSYISQGRRQGVSVTDMLSSWTGLALALRCNGDYLEAGDVSRDAYDYGREEIGADHYLTVRAAINLSIALRLAGSDDDDARELASDALSRCEMLFGEGNPDTLAAAANLANLLRALDQLPQAADLADTTARRYAAVYGSEHPYSYCAIGSQALLKRAAGDFHGARALDEAALAGLDARLTRDHHYSLAVATNLTSDLAALGDTEQARRLGEDTLRRLTRLLGEAHPLSLGCAANLAADLRAGGAVEAAEQLLSDTQSRYAKSLGSGHPSAVRAAAANRVDADFDPPPI